MDSVNGTESWKYYNHAMIPTTAPHEIPGLHPILDGSIWKRRRGAIGQMDIRF